MKSFSNAVLAVSVLVGAVLLGVHANRALHASVPNDMPADSQFLASGYDLSHNEAQGDWVSCRRSEIQDSDYCRVTDVKGTVVYQGEYLPLTAPQPLESAQMKIAKVNPNKMWVQGPAEGQPVPVISLTGGMVLVPAQDREALAARWNAEPEELERVSERDR